MRILLDTNIIIYREANYAPKQEIGILFSWLEKLHYVKCIHPETVSEIRRHQDREVVETFEIKIKNYHQLKTAAPVTEEIRAIHDRYDKNKNDITDTLILNEVYSGRVSALITEDRKIHRKAVHLGIADKVHTVDGFLEKVTAENPNLADYQVLSVKKDYFGNIDLNDNFFDSFRVDYAEFNKWFNKKADEISYICKSDSGEIIAFLYVKHEGLDENYSDIEPRFSPKKRLKVGTFKVITNGYKLGERFLKIIFDNALRFSVEEIYVTLFNKTLEQNRLSELLTDWGFIKYGTKNTSNGNEDVYVRDFSLKVCRDNPCLTFPFLDGSSRKYLVPIYPKYHTELFPDSILRTESPLDFIENRPNRNAISKVYISRSLERDLQSGDIIIFYRTKSGGSAFYTSVTTTIGVVQNVILDIEDENQFISLCRKRSVFSDSELREHWNFRRGSKPFIVNFLYVYTFPRRMNLKSLIESGVINSVEDAPRGFFQINDMQFNSILEGSNADKSIIIN